MKSVEYELERLKEDHPVQSDLFIPYLIARLSNNPESREARVTIQIRGLPGSTDEEASLLLKWRNTPMHPIPVSENVVTELAACGLACAILACFSNVVIQRVTQKGDRFDYVTSDGTTNFALEVSGTTIASKFKSRHALKVQQLLNNPWGLDGYVVVVDFSSPRAIFSFHQSNLN